MLVSIPPLGRFLVVGLLFGAPLAAHSALVAEHGTALAGWLIASQAGLVSWAALSLAAPSALRRYPVRGYLIRLAVCSVAGGLTIAAWYLGGMLAASVSHAIVFTGLLMLFAASLAPGREPIITRVARLSRGALSDELVLYTRRVTLAWCCFFASQLGVSAMLGLWAPPAWWSAFVNLCPLPLVALMFGSELAYRRWRHGLHTPAAPLGRRTRIAQVVGQIRAPFRKAGM